MASVHIREIQAWLTTLGQPDAEPGAERFLEIRFDAPDDPYHEVDPEFAGRVITVDSPQGIVTISFDELGRLSTIDIS
jgi:YD repeat-containing protein